jgi:hypothetical protein
MIDHRRVISAVPIYSRKEVLGAWRNPLKWDYE